MRFSRFVAEELRVRLHDEKVLCELKVVQTQVSNDSLEFAVLLTQFLKFL